MPDLETASEKMVRPVSRVGYGSLFNNLTADTIDLQHIHQLDLELTISTLNAIGAIDTSMQTLQDTLEGLRQELAETLSINSTRYHETTSGPGTNLRNLKSTTREK